MSRGIASFLILIVSIQQIICQDDFQDFVRTKLEKLENENTKLTKKVELYKKMSLESKSRLESVVTDYQHYKEKTTQEMNMCKEQALLTAAKSCWQIGMQGITHSGIIQF